MTAEALKRIFFRYLNGRASEKETQAVDLWYEELNVEHAPVSSLDKQEIATRIRQELRSLATEQKRSSRFFLVRITAIVLTALAITLYVYQEKTLNPKLSNLIMATNTTLKDSLVKLPDGSTVLLEPGAVLEYPREFGITKRSVRLIKGEGFFSIAHKDKHPFSVACTSGLNVDVLGTSFTIIQDPNNRHLLVKVATGKVALRNDRQILTTLYRGQSARYDVQQKQAVVIKAESKRYVPILFRERSLASVVKELSYLYHVDIKLGTAVNPALRSTASFSSRQEVHEILSLLCKLHGLQFHISKDKSTYILHN